MVGRAAIWVNSSSWVTVKLFATGLWVSESCLSLLFCPANKDWSLQSCSPLESLSSPLPHCSRLLVRDTWAFPPSALPLPLLCGSSEYLVHPLLLALSPFLFCFLFFLSDKELVLPLRLCHLFWSLPLKTLRPGPASVLSRHHPVQPLPHLLAFSHILWSRLQVSSHFVEDNLYFCLIFGDNFLLRNDSSFIFKLVVTSFFVTVL